MAGFVAHLDAYGILPIAFAGFSIYTGRINYMQEIERNMEEIWRILAILLISNFKDIEV